MKEQSIAQILSFWFDEITPKKWFFKDKAFDALLAERYGKLVNDALGGRLDSWATTKDGTLALILLLDQITRNIHRNTPLAFAGDEMAVAHALNATAKGYLDDAPNLDDKQSAKNQFTLMPLMHSEDRAIHNKAKHLFAKYTNDFVQDYLERHSVIIERSGRYPHRNAILGRPSTDEEIAFLKEPNSSF